MKSIYLDIMEKTLLAYTPLQIREYIDEVKRDGLTEHGFARLGANIGILMAHGRATELKNEFTEIIDLCLYGFAHPINPRKAGNNFAVREVCHAIKELEGTDVIDKNQLDIWKNQLAELDIQTTYTDIVSKDSPTPHNWAYFAVVSEQARGLLCGKDYTEFLEHQLPSQLIRLDENKMYRDGEVTGPYQPIVYDIVTRNLIGLSLFMGYNGKYAGDIEKMMECSDDITLKMQSVTGELAFGGRSNQCMHNEMMYANYCELRASLLNKKGDGKKASQFKAAAKKATDAAIRWLFQKPSSHIKNRFDPDLQYGCEGYSYFNKYMITVASNAYLAYLVADDSITPSKAPADEGGYIAKTGDDFHKVVINEGGYFLEFDCNADFRYDACGLGRVHKKGCDPRVCLSVPFPQVEARYKLETPNAHPLSVCCYKNTENGIVTSAELLHTLTSGKKGIAEFECGEFLQKYTVSESGIDIEFFGADGILLPAFLYDGAEETEITAKDGAITVEYNGSICKYTFLGMPYEYGVFFNRNGRYKVFRVEADRVHIELGRKNEL